jgi:hypothetical protein
LASIERQPATVLIFSLSQNLRKGHPWKEGGIEDGLFVLDQLFKNSPRFHVSLHRAPVKKTSKIIMVSVFL